MTKYSLGLVPDIPSTKDFLASAFIPVSVTLPENFELDLSWYVSHQLSQPMCTAFTVAELKKFCDNKEYSKILDFSEQWFYAKCKSNGGYQGAGEYPRVCMDTLLKYGICEESYHPYENRYPSVNSDLPGADENALKYRISSYVRVTPTMDSIRQAIYQVGPVGVSIMCWTSFFTPINGICPAPTGKQEGGHMITACGWRTVGGKLQLKLKNSWGADWGEKGYVWVPESVWDAISLRDCWTIVDMLEATKHWTDWPDTNILEQDIVFKHGIFEGYLPDRTTIRPWDTVKKSHVVLVAARLKMPITTALCTDYSEATRGWTKEQFPMFQWDSQRDDEPLTRFQLILLAARYILSKGGI